MNFEDMPINEQFFAGFDKQSLKVRAPWPREAEDRVNQLLGQVAGKEAERMRLAECLRLIVMTEAAVNLAKQRSDLNTAAKHRLVNAAVSEKNQAIERAAILLRGLGA